MIRECSILAERCYEDPAKKRSRVLTMSDICIGLDNYRGQRMLPGGKMCLIKYKRGIISILVLKMNVSNAGTRGKNNFPHSLN